MSKPTVTTSPVTIERIYTHENGVGIPVLIDFKNRTISLVEHKEAGQQKSKTKSWQFANRGLEYMQGWDNIFEAMRWAVKFATIELEQYVEEEEKKAYELSIKMQEELNKEN